MFNKNEPVKVTPKSYPNVAWLGVIISSRKSKFGWINFKVKYDCGGMMLTNTFSEKELSKC